MTVPVQNLPALVKRSAVYLTALFLLLMIYGCPYSSVYKIDTEPQYQTEETYTGKWATIATDENGRQRPVKMILSINNDYENDLCFTGYFDELNNCNIAVNDTIRGTAFMSVVDSRKFFNIKIKGENYISEVIYEDGKLSLLPLCEHFTTKIVKSDAELKRAVLLHFKTRLYPLYDELFCLRDIVKVN